MPALIKYAMLLVADLTIIGCVAQYLFQVLQRHTPSKELPPHHYKKWEKLAGIAALGGVLALYGAFSLLFSWIPRRWGYAEEMGVTLTILAFFGTAWLLDHLKKTAVKISELQF